MKKTIIQLLFIFLFLNPLYASVGDPSSLYQENYQPSLISVSQWEEIHLTWYNKFNPAKPNKVMLLRPKNWALQHGLIPNHYNKQWAASNGLPVRTVFVSSVAPFYPDKKKSVQPASANSNRVTGIYIHDTDTVRTWKFIDRKQHLTIIHATPNHPFYIKDLKKFLPLQKITPAMTLVDDRQHTIHLLCPAQKNRQCGLPYHPDRVSTVYNIEVDQQHQYFVSGEHILVHNCNTAPAYHAPSYGREPAAPVYHYAREPAASAATPDRSDYLVVGCGTVQRPGYIKCAHPTIDTIDIDYTAQATYTSWDDVPRGKYNNILLERTPTLLSLLDRRIAPRVRSGARAYFLSSQSGGGAIESMIDTEHFKYTRMLEPEEGYALLNKFENSVIRDLKGKSFFYTNKQVIKNYHVGNMTSQFIKKDGELADRRSVLLEYTRR